MPSSHLILCRPLLLLFPIPPSIRIFSNESTLCMRWPKYWSFSFSIIPSKEIPGLISFRMDWLDLLAVQGTLKSLLQHHSLKASILWHSAFNPPRVMLKCPHNRGIHWNSEENSQGLRENQGCFSDTLWSILKLNLLHTEKELATNSSILAGKSHGWRSLAGSSQWGREESDTTEQLTTQQHMLHTALSGGSMHTPPRIK